MNWKDHLNNIYGAAAAGPWIPKLRERIEAAKPVMEKEANEIKPQNVILITYPDQINGAGPKLAAFEKFAGEYLEGIFDVIHFLPFCPYSSDDGFSVIDYRKLADGLGEWEDLKRLAEKFTLMYDFVCNHISAESSWFQNCLDGDEKYRDYFIETDPNENLSGVIRPRTTPLLTPFQTAEGVKYYWTTFSADQIDLNYANPEVLYEAVDILLSYLEKGGKWIRLDAIGFLWKEIGTTCMHHEKTHEIIKLLRSILEEVCPAGRIITETNVPHQYNISYFGNGTDESHMVYQFPLPLLVLYSFYKENAEILSSWASGLSLPSDKTGFFNFLASHDGIGVNPIRNIVPEEEINALIGHLQEKSGALVSYKENPDGSQSAYEINVSYFSAVKEGYDFPTAKRRFLNAHGVLLGMKGDPAIYIHSYLGSENDMEGVRTTGMNRSINRQKFNYYELLGQLEPPENRREQVREEIERLIRVRKSSDAFDTNAEQEILNMQEELFAYIRRGKTQTVLCLHNFSGRSVEAKVTRGVDMFTGEIVTECVILNPFGFRWIII